ncbi:ATP-binding cassette subfamily B protein [Nonlabens dokdonensis]|uniref:ABC-type transporter ATP-binding and permease component n=2 Tax=Nonlabens dokdonensis TaxID=328515 RepID=L7WG19_NONDD|nr:ABC transporter ATP-binding protein [Nonlabens dokdonensis]AGC77843.1 ABC-type transporter ATP-binding and permease component [Nonlabens dokdonensis DSW-6]PZX39625.1 ATP-binding cassette subfamily B protein [Nonlabens dokdonensis]
MARRVPASIKEQSKKGKTFSFSALKTLPRFFKEIWRVSPKLFLTNFLARLLTAVSPVVLLWVGKLIIDEVIFQISLDVQDLSQLWTYVAIELSVAVLADLLNRLINLTDGLIGDLYSNASSEKIIRKTNELTLEQLEDPDFYDKLERARQQTSGRVGLMSASLSQIQSIISIGSLIAGLIYFEPLLIILLVLSIIPSFINEAKYSSHRYSVARSWTAERRELDYLRFIGANNQTAKEVKLFGLTDYIAGRFKKLSGDYYEINKKLSLKQSLFGSLFNILGILSYYGAYIFIIFKVISGTLSIGELTFLSGSFNRLRNSLQGFFSRFTAISESSLYLRDYFDFLDIEIKENAAHYTPIPEVIKTGFELKNVHFGYAGSDVEVLKGVNFTIKAGEKIAFVGQNGAGKTTLIKLILRFYEPTQGEILLDGINISKFNKQEYRKRFGVIFQDFFKYEFKLRENIAVGNIEEISNDPKIEDAAQRSLADQVIEVMKGGLDQQLGRRFAQGQELSGGQWQKVALARAYMKDADVIVLDEPTSALDAQAEYDVFERFIGLTKGKTSIIISHRFSTVRMADRILVLENGTIAEIGTHEELMAKPQLYEKLFNLQAAGYQ